MLDALKQLVDMESPSDHIQGVNRVGCFLMERFSGLGFQTRTIPQAAYGDHIRAEFDQPGKPRILFYGHMDTVFPLGSGWPFAIDAGRAYGPGVSDMKSGLLSLVFAFQALAATGTLPVSARVLFNSDEEIGSPTSMPLIPDLIRDVDYGCVLEPAEPDGTVLIRRKGIGKFLLTVTGRAAHAGQQPELGINANRELAYLVLDAEDLADPAKGTTVNAGRIEGGTAAYIISDWARAIVDVRVWDKPEQARIEKALADLKGSNRVAGTSIDVSGSFHRPPMVPLPKTEDLTGALQTAAALCGQSIQFGGGGAASDGNNLVAAGIPTIDGMGPIGGRAHSRDEYLEIESFFDRTLLLAAFLTVIGSQSP